MSVEVLARKWRPRDFASCVGQQHVVRALANALTQGRLHHAYLFTGTRGVGKTTLSRLLAKALNCVGPDGSGGVTADPCNRCPACTAIDAGRFVDYIEMDAASNRGVDEMTALLERAVYAPSNARFKVYMIDEVHMLSTHAFNAMLKTLEEPPDYVKFILATTDPQKVPVTVLSRCLQFNLKPVPAAEIAARLAAILDAEGIAAEDPALRALSLAARGSLRDALSLLDQAIAYGAGCVTVEGVRGMLGAIDGALLLDVLRALVARDAKALLATVDAMAAAGVSFGQALRDLASWLHRIALAQQAPAAADALLGDEAESAAAVRALARELAPDEVQLYYQIALHGRNDLSLAPDETAGLSMTLLRMLAFAPQEGAAPGAAPAAAPGVSGKAAAAKGAEPAGARPPALATTGAPPGIPQATPARGRAAGTGVAAPVAVAADSGAPHADEPLPRFTGDWAALVQALPVQGLVRELAARAEFVALEGRALTLRVASRSLATPATVERLAAALSQHLGGRVRLALEFGATSGSSLAETEARAREARRAQAEAAIYADPAVQQFGAVFGAEIDPQSIRPNDSQ